MLGWCIARFAPFHELQHVKILLSPFYLGDVALPPAEFLSKLYLCQASVLPYLL